MGFWRFFYLYFLLFWFVPVWAFSFRAYNTIGGLTPATIGIEVENRKNKWAELLK